MATQSELSVVECKNLYAYLKTLPSTLLETLYKHPCPCMAIFRDLSAVAQQLLLRQLFIEQVLAKSVVSSWITSEGKKDFDDAVRILTELKIWTEAPLSSGLMGWKLNDDFREGIQAVTVGGRDPWNARNDDENIGDDSNNLDVKYLEKIAGERWELVLYSLAGIAASRQHQPSADTLQVLTSAGLIKNGNRNGDGITEEGFRFLLMDIPGQVWHFILAYLHMVQKWGMSLIECLSFIFQLSFSQVGKQYSCSNLTPNQQKMLTHFRDYGLVFMKSRKNNVFYPTNLVVNLSSGANRRIGALSEGYVIVETNYRLYAYTDSPLKVALVGYFCEMLYRFPNLALGMITRESIRNALTKGISADEIVKFLRMHAHPQMLESNPILPSTLTDQIKLWEMEKDRFEYKEGVLYNSFGSQKDFDVLYNYANDLGVVVWSNHDKRMVIVSPAGHEPVRAFWKRQKKD